MNPRDLLMGAFRAALAAADPARILPPHLPSPPRGRTLVVGGGKAAASMALAVETHWPQDAPLSGCVVTRYQHGLPTRRIEVIEASHPLPDGRGEQAARHMLDLAGKLGADDLLIALVSGGGSSLLAAPVPGVSLKALRQVTRALLASGARIESINTVRKQLTLASGGRLARAAHGARVEALIISDVTGDDPVHIASGPCAPEAGTCADALELLARYGVDPPDAIRRYLEACPAADRPVPADHPCFARTRNTVIGRAADSLEAARRFLEDAGVPACVLSDRISGDAVTIARQHAALVRALSARPFALLSGGETTVTLKPGHGRGGRNTTYLLALALALGTHGIWALACDTDGIDGSESNAGACLTPNSLERARQCGLDPSAPLHQQDSYRFFETLGDLVHTGPTRTNVNDFRLLLVL